MNDHNYHFVLNKELKDKICILSKKSKMSLSDTGNYILHKTIKFFEILHYKNEEQINFTTYQNINWNIDMHIFMTKDLYRKIKHLSDTYFAFSVAIVVRWLINYYFDNIYNEKTNQENEKKLVNIEKDISKLKNIKKWNKVIKNKELFGKIYYQLTFNEKFSIIGYNFLQSG